MSAELVGGLVALLVALIGGSVGWQQIGEHGEKRAELRRAKEEVAHANKRAEVAHRAPAEKSEAYRVLRGRLARAARRLRRVRAGRE